MGREASCHCRCGLEAGQCKVLLEPPDLILRGAIRRRAPINSLAHLEVRGDKLAFRVGDLEVYLDLGAGLAQKWKQAIETPPPTLAHKLGITSESKLLLLGEVESEELQAAIDQAEPIAASLTSRGKDPNLILICAATQAELNKALVRSIACAGDPPMWIIYPKGTKSNLPEAAVRNALRSQGFIDTKVASVSSKLTALRFIKRK